LEVTFNDPVTPEEDPSVDLVSALTRKDAGGLWIPDRRATDDKKKWSPSHPEKHTELFIEGARELRALRARVARRRRRGTASGTRTTARSPPSTSPRSRGRT
jgi:hypothetical protein